jgi:hypothetical protein
MRSELGASSRCTHMGVCGFACVRRYMNVGLLISGTKEMW